MISAVLVVMLALSPDSGPAGAIERLRLAHVHKSEVEYGAVLTADYSFHSSDQRVRDYMVGWTRDHEIRSAHGLFHGVTNGVGKVMPAADSIRMEMEGLVDGPDPEHPDSTEHYRMVAVRALSLTIHLPGNKGFKTTPSLHVFHVVRGDAALLVPGQSADSTTWYIRRWLENVDATVAALNEDKGRCENPGPQPARPGAEEGATVPGVPLALAIHPLGNPACPALSIQCDLPAAGSAEVEVYDVMGRRVNRREVRIARAGTMSIEAGAGARIVPGVYWVRLTQASHRPTTRMLVVAR